MDKHDWEELLDEMHALKTRIEYFLPVSSFVVTSPFQHAALDVLPALNTTIKITEYSLAKHYPEEP